MATTVGLLAALGLILAPTSGLRDRATRAPSATRLERAFGRLPLSFEVNRGQTDRRVDFLARGRGYTLFLTPRGSALSLVKYNRRGTPARVSALAMTLAGASHSHGIGVGRLLGTSNYFIGSDPKHWHAGVTNYRSVLYRGVYPGVDVLYHGRQGRLEYDFHLAPGAHPARIHLAFSGPTALSLDRRGDLLLRTPSGVVRQDRPIAYQGRHAVAVRFVLHAHAVGFSVGRYDHSRPLVIDPVLVYSTYLAGDNIDLARDIAVDSSGDAYVTGGTYSVDFATTSGAFQVNRGGNITPGGTENAFVSKLNESGTALVYSTYLGGSLGDEGRGIAVDSSGRAYVTGNAQSSNFPTTVNAYQATHPSNYSAFLSVLSPSGSRLDYSTFLGGTSGPDGALSVAVDASGDAYLTGSAQSTDFPVTAPAGGTPLQATATGSGDAFVAKLDPSRSGAGSLVYSTYLGGTQFDLGLRIAVDSSGNAYVTGETGSNDFPTTASAFQASNAGGVDAFVTKVNPTGTALVYSTYLGGSGNEDQCCAPYVAGAIAVDSAGHAYVTGATRSGDFPTTPFAFQKTPGPGFVAKLSVDGSNLVYSSYLSGNAGFAIAVEGSGAAYVAGRTAGQTAFPLIDPVAEPVPGGGGAATLTKIRPDGAGLLFATTLGGNGDTWALGVAIDSSGAAYLTGPTTVTDLPTVNPIQANVFEDQGIFANGFVAKVAPTPASAPLVTGLSRRGGDTGGGDTVVISGHGFTGATAVSFGSVPAASFTVDSDTQVTAVDPPHAPGTVPATVTSPQGTSPANPVAQFAYGLGAFAATASPPVSSTQGTVVQLSDGRVLAVDGNSGAAEIYDPSTGTWSATGSPDYVLNGATATLLRDGKVLLAGGDDYASYGTPYAELYDPATGTWSPTGQMNFLQDQGETATLLRNGEVLVADGAFGQGAELYDPATGTWTTTGSMHDARFYQTATLLDGPACTGSSQPSYCGDVLVTGGYNLASTELYNPTTGTWSYAAPLPVAVNFANAVPLANGNVLVAGGADQYALSNTTAEVYYPATNHWSLTSPMLTPTATAAAAVLPGGQVLMAGGIIGSSGLDSAEVYDPITGTWTSAGLMSAYQASYFGPGYPPLAAPLTTNCGANCGKVLVTDGTFADLYTPHSPPGPPPAPPANLSPPTITGMAVQGDTLAETHGSWSNRPTGYDLAWLRCGTAGNACSAIGGAHANTYTLTSADVGATIRVQEAASNAGGTGTPARSAPTAIVQAAGPPTVTGYRLTNRTFAVSPTATPLFATAARRHPKGTAFKYTLSQAATVKIVISQRLRGRRAGKRCAALSRKLRHAKACTRVLSRGTLTRTSRQGANTVAFSGRIGSKALKPGRYQATLTATATGTSGKKSRPQTVYFTVVAR